MLKPTKTDIVRANKVFFPSPVPQYSSPYDQNTRTGNQIVQFCKRQRPPTLFKKQERIPFWESLKNRTLWIVPTIAVVNKLPVQLLNAFRVTF